MTMKFREKINFSIKNMHIHKEIIIRYVFSNKFEIKIKNNHFFYELYTEKDR